MTPYAYFLLAVHDQDLDQRLPNAGAHLRVAEHREHVTRHPTFRSAGDERARPVKITKQGTEYLEALGAISATEPK